MHPKQIIKTVEGLGAKLVLEGDNLYIENPIQVYPELEQFIQSYKKRIIDYMNGSYSDKEHAIKQTVEKIIMFMSGVPQDINTKVDRWLEEDDKALTYIMRLVVDLSSNGWKNCKEPFANYETVETDKLSVEIYERAMSYFKKG